MRTFVRSIVSIFLLFFCQTALFAQVKKNKASVSTDSDRQIPAIKHKRDTAYKRNPLQNAESKKIVLSIPCHPHATVFLQNMMHKVNILTSNNNKVMLVTTVYYQGTSSLTDSQWFSKLKVSLTGNENNIEVKSGDFIKGPAQDNLPAKGVRMLDTIFNGITVFDSLGNAVGRRSSSDRNIILYIPAGAKVDIESKYADVTIENDMTEVKARMNNGGLTLMDADQLYTTSVYGRIYAGNIKHAEVSVKNGKLKAKNINTLDITSKNSSVAVDKVDILTIRDSQADQFDIQEAQSISGKKAYGDLRLTTLTGSVDLSGVNADVNIKRIQPSVKSIKIDTQYADLALSVRDLKDYTVAFEGTGGTVYTSFEKTAVTETSFHTKVGSGKLTSFLLKCNNCTVAFK